MESSSTEKLKVATNGVVSVEPICEVADLGPPPIAIDDVGEVPATDQAVDNGEVLLTNEAVDNDGEGPPTVQAGGDTREVTDEGVTETVAGKTPQLIVSKEDEYMEIEPGEDDLEESIDDKSLILKNQNEESLQSTTAGDHEEDTCDGAGLVQEIYKINENGKKGKCIIISMENFHPRLRLDRREGTAVDEERIVKVFESLRYEVFLHKDQEVHAIKDLLLEASLEDHTNCDSFVFCIMTHGFDHETVYGYDKTIKVEEIIRGFLPQYCRSLTGKPKMFFIQACRGPSTDEGASSESESDGVNHIEKLPTHADCFISYSTVPKYLSYRQKFTGSRFIQSLCAVLNKYSATTDLLGMITMVHKEVAHYLGKEQKQMPSTTFTLTKKVFFQSQIGFIAGTEGTYSYSDGNVDSHETMYEELEHDFNKLKSDYEQLQEARDQDKRKEMSRLKRKTTKKKQYEIKRKLLIKHAKLRVQEKEVSEIHCQKCEKKILPNDVVWSLNCEHEFHEKCLRDFFYKSAAKVVQQPSLKCPECQTQINSKTPTSDSNGSGPAKKRKVPPTQAKKEKKHTQVPEPSETACSSSSL